MASVMVIVGPNKGEMFPIDENAAPEGAVLGRDPACHVQLTDEKVSRRHARIFRDPASDACRLADLGSVNGSTLNGVLVEGAPLLRDGDTIGLGASLLRFSDRKLAHGPQDYAAMQHIPRQREKFRETQA